MNPRKVLYLSTNSKKGGAEQVTLSIAKSHDPSRWQAVFYFFSDGPFVEEVRRSGLKTILSRFPRRPRLRDPISVWLRVRELKATLARERVDLVHSVMGYAHLYGGPAARAAGVPEVWYQHGPTGKLDWLTGRVPTRTLFVNSLHTLQAQARFHARADRTVVVHPGVAPPALTRLTVGRRVRIAFFGRVAALKNHAFFLAALAALKAGGADFEAEICGGPFGPDDDVYAQGVAAKVRELGLDGRVEMVGHVDDPLPRMAACQILVNCTIGGEAFGMTVVEAMSLGLAVVAPREGGALEIVSDGEDGLLFRPGDVDDLALKIKALIDSTDLRDRLGARASAKVRERFSLAGTTASLESEYEALASESGRRRGRGLG